MIMQQRNSAVLGLLLAALGALASSPAGATGYACAIKPSSDGFVALREGPSTRQPIIARTRAHELVDTMDAETEDRIISGNWIRVTWYAGTRRTAASIPDVTQRTGRVGWINRDLLNCFE